MINFRLKDLDNIEAWGHEPELSLHWFGLTDGNVWLTMGKETIYEYTKEAMSYFGSGISAYNDYPLSRFIEDFTELFGKISESVPEELYELTKDLKKFQFDAKKWLDIYDTDEDSFNDFYLEEYDKLISWVYSRELDSRHLIGGPQLSFFRKGSNVRIIWATEHVLENGCRLWTANDGNCEMDYSDFIEKIKVFGQSFFDQMDIQIDLALAKDWGLVRVDKQRLIEEHQRRKNDFYTSLALLDQEVVCQSDWIVIGQLYKRMMNELT